MGDLININSYPVKPVLKLLLTDKTTKQNIVFGTDSYEHLGDSYKKNCQIEVSLLKGWSKIEIQPRVLKKAADQADRTKKKAEVMTPAWIVNNMNNHCDEEWFGYKNAFNTEEGEKWHTSKNPVSFPEGKTWQKYVDSMRLEITCGEAPYLVSRYDATTGEPIPVKDRVGILDRKLRVVGENTDTKDEWLKWTIRAFQATYGYEYQGDNLLLARINLLITFVDYMQDKWGELPTSAELRKIANIIAWNIWQMDGLTGIVPYSYREASYQQMTMFDFLAGDDEQEKPKEAIPARIFDWRSNESVTYNSLKEKR